MTVCFIGHRKISRYENVKNMAHLTVVELIQNGANTFLFGSRSEFDALCLDVVTDLKKLYHHIKRIYVRAEYQYISKLYENYLLASYDETYFPTKISFAGKCSYVERNEEMIDKSDICVFYYNKNYIVPPKQQKFSMQLPDRKVNSGTRLAYEYAVSKKKQIINLYS